MLLFVGVLVVVFGENEHSCISRCPIRAAMSTVFSSLPFCHIVSLDAALYSIFVSVKNLSKTVEKQKKNFEKNDKNNRNLFLLISGSQSQRVIPGIFFLQET